MNRYEEYVLDKIETQRQIATNEGKCLNLISAFDLIEKCFKKQKKSMFKVTVPYIPCGIYGRKSLKDYNLQHNTKLRFKNMQYRYISRYSIEAAAKLCGFYIIDEYNCYNPKTFNVTYILRNFVEEHK